MTQHTSNAGAGSAPHDANAAGNPHDLANRIRHGWEISAAGYSRFIVDELQDGTAEHWRAELLRALDAAGQPCDGQAAPAAEPAGTGRSGGHGSPGRRRVLDVGTGPGLFAILLTQEGWDATAIDGSPAMLEQARANAHGCGVQFAVQQMEAQKLLFGDGSFDAIVNRNVMWTVADPRRAYREFFRVLAPGGRLVVYDGDHLADLRDPAIATRRQAMQQEYMQRYGHIRSSFDPARFEEARGWRTDLPLAQEKRPQWDEAELASIGFENIRVRYVDDALVPRKAHGGATQDFAPMFALSATKPAAA